MPQLQSNNIDTSGSGYLMAAHVSAELANDHDAKMLCKWL
jgi:hypothetical protein